MDRRTFVVATSTTLLTVPLRTRAQTGRNVRKIGFLGVSRVADTLLGTTQAFIDALSDLGWTEGRDVTFEYRWSDQRNDRLPELAADLVRASAEVIVVTSGATGTKAAKDASNKIPIVMAAVADPVKFGLIANFAHPGGNVTGLALPLVDWGKWLELAREGVRGARQIAVIANSTNIVYADYVAQNEAAARRLGIELQMLPVVRAEDFVDAFAAMKRESARALVVGPDPLFISNMQKIIGLAAAHRLPVVAANRRYAELGAMISYGTDFNYVFRRAASYVDKILRGTKPSDLPVEQSDRFELVVNLKTAETLGLTIPQSLLLRADEIIQ
jgi:putative tryptophan/tyrosine transport system substrate-binding protein